MRYVSTRGQCDPKTFQDVVLTGLAPDGGLFVPESLPDFSSRLGELSGLSFQEIFQSLLTPFVGEALSPETLAEMTERSYAVFTHPDIIPVRRVGKVYVCELFHGPTLAFKDVALQFLGNLFEHLLGKLDKRMTVLGATSGDTGAAAIQALRGREGVQVFILYPNGRVSPIQEMQMTAVPDANVHAIAIEGSFDDAQDLVKSLFNDREFNAEVSLGAINSINWVRVMAQITYFFHAYFKVVEASAGDSSTSNGRKMVLGDPVRFSVPTGNFGHIYAGLLARRMGLPVDKFILATNANAILHELVQSGDYRRGTVQQTLSPSMDIQVASNFERYLFDLSGRNSTQVRQWLGDLSAQGGFSLDAGSHKQVCADMASERVDDETTVETIRTVHEETGYMLDPHSAIGYRAAQIHLAEGLPVIAMATAHPAKFSDAIHRAIGRAAELPPSLARLPGLPQRKEILSPEPEVLRTHIRKILRGSAI